MEKAAAVTETEMTDDQRIGARIRYRRNALNMSQQKLGEALGLTFQQVQKYEKGVNSLRVSMLLKISKVLDTPHTWFIEGLADGKTEFNDDSALFLTDTIGIRIARALSGASYQVKTLVADLCEALTVKGTPA